MFQRYIYIYIYIYIYVFIKKIKNKIVLLYEKVVNKKTNLRESQSSISSGIIVQENRQLLRTKIVAWYINYFVINQVD